MSSKSIIAHPAQETTTPRTDLCIDYPLEDELLAACEYALEWFEKWDEHAEHKHDFGGEYRVMQKLRRAIAEVWIRDEL